MKQSARVSIAWLVALVVGMIALGALWKLFPVVEWLETALTRIEDMGTWGILAYFLLYITLEMVAFPNTPLNIGAGLLFSLSVGCSLAVAATLIASMGTFLFSRYLAQDWTRRRLKALPSFNALLDSLHDGSFQIVLLARLNPLIPASVKNYGFALTEISFAKYSLASFLGQTPIALAYVYLGWAGGMAILRGEEKPGAMQWIMIGMGVLLSIAMVIVVSWYGRRKMKKLDIAVQGE